MRFVGAIRYVWSGELRHVVSAPELRIDLRDEWVMVGRPQGGTVLVAWESLVSIRGWAAPNVAAIEHRLTEPTSNGRGGLETRRGVTDESAKSHHTFRHRAEVRESTSASERHADEGEGT